MNGWRARLVGLFIVMVLASGPAACGGGQLGTNGPETGSGPGPSVGTGDTYPDTSPRLTPLLEATAFPTPELTSPVVASPTLASMPATSEPLPAPTDTPTLVAANEGPDEDSLPLINTLPAPTATAETPSGERIHIVAAGENLYRIGLQYGVSWVAIAEYNGLTNPDQISVGQELRIPPSPTLTPEAATPEAAAPPAQAPAVAAGTEPAPSIPPGEAGETVVIAAAVAMHQVDPGETLYSISARYGVSWAQVAEANGLASPNQIIAGQVLKIPADVPGPAPVFTHQVHAGETLARIAAQYGVSLANLAEANDLTLPYVIYRGQVLVIPEKND